MQTQQSTRKLCARPAAEWFLICNVAPYVDLNSASDPKTRALQRELEPPVILNLSRWHFLKKPVHNIGCIG